ncbi:hypothetical protein niasHS_011307 [Heterodera schachtii]|uniref:RRM domain-containing protein n=1 Tax=Heterodera schachtii TaxID=97005 RepID=A0ABD2J1L8_HETSC
MSEEQNNHPSATPNPSDGQLSGSSDTNHKIFIVGLSDQTTNDSLNKYFSKFGKVTKCGVVCDAKTKKSRGFGFVEFDTQNESSAVLSIDPHKIDGKVVSVKPWVDKQKQKSQAVKKRTRANPQNRAEKKAMTNKKGMIKDVKSNNLNDMRGRKKEIVEADVQQSISSSLIQSECRGQKEKKLSDEQIVHVVVHRMVAQVIRDEMSDKLTHNPISNKTNPSDGKHVKPSEHRSVSSSLAVLKADLQQNIPSSLVQSECRGQKEKKLSDEQIVHVVVHRMVAQVIRDEMSNILTHKPFSNETNVMKPINDEQIVRATVNRMSTHVSIISDSCDESSDDSCNESFNDSCNESFNDSCRNRPKAYHVRPRPLYCSGRRLMQ